MFISIKLDVISVHDKNNFPLTREITGTHPSEEVEDNRRPTMCVEYIDTDNTIFLIYIFASHIDHQI